jgi:hypothetical protein
MVPNILGDRVWYGLNRFNVEILLTVISFVLPGLMVCTAKALYNFIYLILHNL